jgi:DHA3 family macrolide efflux protein-like MFS transporter
MMKLKFADVIKLENWMKRFFTIWFGQAFSLIGSSLVGFALVWWMTTTTGSATVLATAAIMEMLPRVVIGPMAGALVDRWSRRWVMIVADGTIATATAVILYLSWRGVLQPWHVYTLMFIRATGGVFHLPSMQASTSLMVPEDQLTRVQGLNQMLTGIMNIASPPLGALLVSYLPLHSILGIDICTAVIAMAPLFFIFIPQPAPRDRSAPTSHDKSSMWREMGEGFSYIWNWPGLRDALGISVLLNLVAVPAMSLMPLLVTGYFQGDALDLATMQSLWAVGLLSGGVALSIWGGFRRKISTITFGMIGACIGFALVGFAPTEMFAIALAGITLAGLMNTISNGAAFAMLQSIVEPDLQGRVFSLVISVSGAMSPLGLAIAAPLADRIGINIWFVITAAVSLVGSAIYLLNPAIRYIEEYKLVKRGVEAAVTSPSGST